MATITTEITENSDMAIRNILIVFTFLLSGCAEMGCGGLQDIVVSEENNAKIAAWADERIFSRELPIDKIMSGGFVGPGRRKIAPTFVLATPVTNFSEVRLIGENTAHPAAVFLAKGAYRGVMVSRHNDIDSVLKSEGIVSDEIFAKSQRLAAICRPRS